MKINKRYLGIAIMILLVIVIVAIIVLMEAKDDNKISNNTESILTESSEIFSEETEDTVNGTEVISEEIRTTETGDMEEATLSENVQPAWTVADMDETMYAKSSVNVRKGPGTEYDKLGSLTRNEEVKVTGKCNEYDWYRINYDGNEAYVSCNYLVNEKIVEETTKPSSNNESTSNTNNSVDNNVTEDTYEEADDTPTTPEPAYGTIVYDGYPDDGWIWCPIDSFDQYQGEDFGGWNRCVSQGTMFAKKQDFETLQYYSLLAYPLKTGPGELYDEVHYPTFWVYLGDGYGGK